MAQLCNEPNILNNFCNNRINVLVSEEAGTVLDTTVQLAEMTNIAALLYHPQNILVLQVKMK